jgi:type II secretory pathway pseudopilin PulG
VIAIMGIIAAIALPSINALKPNAAAAATRQVLDAVTHARQLALSQRTTVYLVFLPPGFFNDAAYQAGYPTWSTNDQTLAKGLLDKQLTGYTYVSLRSVGDQPGQSYARYLTPWRTLPQGAYFAQEKFTPQGQKPSSNPVLYIYTNTAAFTPVLAYRVFAFTNTTNIPFPSETTKKPASGNYVALPYVAFNGMGQLVREAGTTGTSSQYIIDTMPQFIPITQGSVGIARDPTTKVALQVAPAPRDVPSGNTTNNFSLVYVDQLTGRARVEHVKVQ